MLPAWKFLRLKFLCLFKFQVTKKFRFLCQIHQSSSLSQKKNPNHHRWIYFLWQNRNQKSAEIINPRSESNSPLFSPSTCFPSTRIFRKENFFRIPSSAIIEHIHTTNVYDENKNEWNLFMKMKQASMFYFSFLKIKHLESKKK